jgi:hypothetical protein
MTAMEDWRPESPTPPPEAFQTDVELVRLDGLLGALALLTASSALRASVLAQGLALFFGVVVLALTVARTVRFDRRRLRARRRDFLWSELDAVRGYRQGSRRVLVLTFASGEVRVSSWMWRFDRLAEFIAAGLHHAR